MNEYDVGQRVRSTVYFEDPTQIVAPVGPNGFTLVDPSIVIGMIHQANGTETSYTHGAPGAITVRESTGKYHLDADTTDDHGVWAIRWKCPPGSTLVTATETEFKVLGSAFVTP